MRVSNSALTWQGQRASHLLMESSSPLSNGAGIDRNTASVTSGTMANRPGAHLYFIKVAKKRGPVKIGRANKPAERLSALQVACPYALKLVGFLDGCGQWEIVFHRYLAGDWMRGEWFEWSAKVEEIITISLAGGDWQSKLAEREKPSVDWFAGGPLYEVRA
jgi:hypothetical protein